MSDIRMNLGIPARFVWIVIGGALLMLGIYLPLGPALSWSAVILGIVLMLTGLSGYCPFCSLLGICAKK